ncbi:MAG: SDR family oxidoreductase [Burkholderiales bacterium]
MDFAQRFTGKGVVVTGAGSGIGRATALRFAHEGAAVALVDVDEGGMAATVALVARPGAAPVHALACDVGDEAAVTRTFAEARAALGDVHVVVNNAGMMVFKDIVDHTADDLARVLAVDLCGAFWFTREAFRACGPGTAIVNVASIHATMTSPRVASYAAAKGALVAFTRAAAIEGKPLGIRVNAVLPGAVETPMLRANPNLRSGAEVLAAGDVGTPDDVAGAIAFLAADDARFITGTALTVDGGRLARL